MKTILKQISFILAVLLLALISTVSAQAAVEAWVQRYSHLADFGESGDKVVADSAGNVIVAGYTDDGINGADFLIIKYSGAGAPLWTNRYNGPGNSYDYVWGLAVDSTGNVVVTGQSSGTSISDYATIKYSGAGVPLWTNRYNGPGDSEDIATAVAVDGSGNVFVTGYSYDSVNSFDYATIKYSSAGVLLWTRRYDGPEHLDERANAIAVDGSGNVFVTGSSYGSVNSFDYATIKYSSAGVLLWTKRYNGPGNDADEAYAIATDSSANVFVTGNSYHSVNSFDYATIKYSGAGVPLWTNRYNGPGNEADQAYAIAADSSGNVFVTGYSRESVGFVDYATVAYSGAGVPLWTNRYNGPGNADDFPKAVAVDGSGNVFVTGYSASSSADPYDYATVAYSGAGVPLWTNRYNGVGNLEDFAQAIAVDGSGNVFVTGSSAAGCATLAYSGAGVGLWTNRHDNALFPVDADDGANAVVVDSSGNVFVTGYSYTSAVGDADYATVAYSGAGMALWTNRYNGPGYGEDRATAMAVDGSGNVFVTGRSDGGGFNYDYATIKYSGTGVPLWTQRYNGPGNGYDAPNAIAVDGSGNVFVTGSSYGTAFGNAAYATIKYSGAGVPLWTNRYTGPGNFWDEATGIAVDGSGNVFVTGWSFGTTYTDYATIKYSGAGMPLWTNRYDGPGTNSDHAYAIAVDAIGNVFVTGRSRDTNFNTDYATLAYSSAGAPLWTNRYDGPANSGDEAYAIAVDGSGNVFVTGFSANTNGATDYTTLAYSGAGVPLWTNRYNGPGNGGDQAQDVAVDGDGTVFVTGYSASTNADPYNNYDYATVAYSGAGVPLWTNRYNGPGNRNDHAKAIAVNGSGNVYVTGSSWGGSYYDYATIKYSSAALLPIPLNYQIIGNQLELSWTNAAFGLQSAPVVEGIYTNILGATSPYTNAFSDLQRYFRLKGN